MFNRDDPRPKRLDQLRAYVDTLVYKEKQADRKGELDDLKSQILVTILESPLSEKDMATINMMRGRYYQIQQEIGWVEKEIENLEMNLNTFPFVPAREGGENSAANRVRAIGQ